MPFMTTANQSEDVAPGAKQDDGGSAMTFFEHLTELRKRIINSLIAIVIGAFAGFYLSKYVIDYITRPILKALREMHLEEKLIYTNPTGYLNLMITLGLYIGIVLASPVVLYQIWLFVAPALYKHERKAIAGFLTSTVFLFLSGIAVAYFIMLPTVLKILIGFQGKGPIQPLISINEYFDLTLMVLLGVGIVFELPILVFFLSLFGIVTPAFLWKNFRYAILIIAVLAAIFAPPDAMTMLIFMAPMVLLYFIGIAVSAVVVKRKREREMARAGAP